VLLRSYRDYNLVAFGDEIFGAPLSLGHLDLTQDAVRSDRRILRGTTEEQVVEQIDLLAQGIETPPQAMPDVIPIERLRKVNMNSGVMLRWGK
jgi:hypothetical protein